MLSSNSESPAEESFGFFALSRQSQSLGEIVENHRNFWMLGTKFLLVELKRAPVEAFGFLRPLPWQPSRKIAECGGQLRTRCCRIFTLEVFQDCDGAPLQRLCVSLLALVPKQSSDIVKIASDVPMSCANRAFVYGKGAHIEPFRLGKSPRRLQHARKIVEVTRQPLTLRSFINGDCAPIHRLGFRSAVRAVEKPTVVVQGRCNRRIARAFHPLCESDRRGRKGKSLSIAAGKI